MARSFNHRQTHLEQAAALQAACDEVLVSATQDPTALSRYSPSARRLAVIVFAAHESECVRKAFFSELKSECVRKAARIRAGAEYQYLDEL